MQIAGNDALALCDQAISLNPEYSRAHAVRGAALLFGYDGEFAAALAAADAAVTLDDNNGLAWTVRAEALAELRRFPLSIAVCEKSRLIARKQNNFALLCYVTGIATDISSHLVNVGKSNKPGYTRGEREDRQTAAEIPPGIMPDAAHDLNALAADLDLPFEVARKALQQAKAELTAHETTSRSATAEPRSGRRRSHLSSVSRR